MNLEIVSKSYDKTINSKINQYESLPAEITEDPYYAMYKQCCESDDTNNSGNRKIRGFLNPQLEMKYIDLGCSANLINYELYKWPSIYHGIDVSPKTIDLLKNFAKGSNLELGGLYCCAIHEMPFSDVFFDIGACVGILEYFQSRYIINAIEEIARVLKPRAKLILDIPNWSHPASTVMAKIEEYLGRPDLFDMTVNDFESLLIKHFNIISRTENMMLTYYLEKQPKVKAVEC